MPLGRGGGHSGRKFFPPLHPDAIDPNVSTHGHFVLSPPTILDNKKEMKAGRSKKRAILALLKWGEGWYSLFCPRL